MGYVKLKKHALSIGHPQADVNRCSSKAQLLRLVLPPSPDELDFSSISTKCTRVEGAHNRGITVAQLQQVREFILLHSDEHGKMSWIDLAPPQHSPTSGQQMSKDSLNLYQV